MPRRRKYPTQTPMGALLTVEPFGDRWHWISIDRIPIGGADEKQQKAAFAFSEAGTHLAIAQGHPEGVPYGGGVVIWHGPVPNAEVQSSLSAWYALEAGDDKPIRALTARFVAMTTEPTKGRTYLYRLFGPDDDLLYIGISLSALGRLGQHLNEKDWAPQVCRTTIESFPTRQAASDAERAAIRTEGPRYNVVHNRAKGTGWAAEDMPDVCHDECSRIHADDTIYFPHQWLNGRAEYRCDRGHEWTCGWGHDGSGTSQLPPKRLPARPAPTAACQHIWLEPVGWNLTCCDCGVRR